MSPDKPTQRKPAWLKTKIGCGAQFQQVINTCAECHLHTVCKEALCPNCGECFSMGTATFLILGNRCSRYCRFCAVRHGPTHPPDTEEPYHVAEAVEKLGITYVVITSVTRDDLPDGGAGHFTETVKIIRGKIPGIGIEILIPDFQGSDEALKRVVEARPNVISHNIETVPRLYPEARPGASYLRSLRIMEKIREIDKDLPVKSGMMLGMGETHDEIRGVLSHLREVNCSLLTLGQYLQPGSNLLPVSRYVSPEEFNTWRIIALEMGFKGVVSGPLVRSSYRAGELYESLCHQLSV